MVSTWLTTGVFPSCGTIPDLTQDRSWDDLFFKSSSQVRRTWVLGVSWWCCLQLIPTIFNLSFHVICKLLINQLWSLTVEFLRHYCENISKNNHMNKFYYSIILSRYYSCDYSCDYSCVYSCDYSCDSSCDYHDIGTSSMASDVAVLLRADDKQ